MQLKIGELDHIFRAVKTGLIQLEELEDCSCVQ